MHETSRIPPFQRLQWKLTLSYVLVTVAGVITVEVILFALLGGMALWSGLFPRSVLPDIQKHALEARPLLETTPINREALAVRLRATIHEDEPATAQGEGGIHFRLSAGLPRLEAAITDARGVVLAGAPAEAWRTDQPLAVQLTAAEAAMVGTALRGGATARRLTGDPSGRSAVAVPIPGSDQPVIGSVYVRFRPAYPPGKFLGMLLTVVFPTAAIVALLSAGAGSLFGMFTARRFTRRVDAMAAAAEAWGRGDLTPTIQEDAPDELGQLGRHLNAMANGLATLMELRQQMAALEERNRLARELHDTVKQQLFAIAMQLGAARALQERDPIAAHGVLCEVEKLAHHAQQDLTAVIQELRPPTETADSVKALRECAEEWSRRHGIAVELRLPATPGLPAAVGQALLRITQEALANVARHSGADKARVSLRRDAAGLCLEIEDYGRGFDTTAPSSGIGRQSMRERAEALPDGQFHIESTVGKGTRITIRCRLGKEG